MTNWLVAMCVLLFSVQAHAAEVWNVGTWKTAQTVQPFLYKDYVPGVQVTVRPFTNPGDQKSALLAGSLEMTGTTLQLAIQAASRGEPVVLVASLGNKCSALVVANNGAITAVADLKGKKIGYVPGTMHEVLLRETLTHAGLNPDKDVRMVRVDFFDMGTALAKGDIDAFLSGEPLPTLARRQGYGKILAYPYFGDSIGEINSGMIMHTDFVKKYPDRVLAMVRAHKNVTEALMRDRKKWLDISAAMFGIDREVLAECDVNMNLVWDMDDVFVSRVRALGKKMLALGMIQKEPDYDILIDRTFVARLRHE